MFVRDQPDGMTCTGGIRVRSGLRGNNDVPFVSVVSHF